MKEYQLMKYSMPVFLYLKAFSSTGGLEKFNRAFIKAINTLFAGKLLLLSSHEKIIDKNYAGSALHYGFNGNKILFSVFSILKVWNCNPVILGHINLWPVGMWIRILYPTKKIILITHGIEVWGKINKGKKLMLEWCHMIVSVSNYTKNEISKANPKLKESKFFILYNTIDPYFNVPTQYNKPLNLLQKHKINENSKIIMTLTRMSAYEKYKGYDKVIEALPIVKKKYPDIIYILAGKYDAEEIIRIKKIIQFCNLEVNVIMPGFISEKDISNYYLMADLFIMPSKKEGFGIVFIEAMACGLPVITGNTDGSVEAIMYGELGTAIDCDSTHEIANAIISFFDTYNSSYEQCTNLQTKVLQHFSFQIYLDNVKKIFSTLHA
ncbi:MAG: glycosyltransferase family 4 protein [Cytophagales bacterium]|nr:glycosyltransferase family 4 protein [Cytophagales bacterium]